MVVAPVPRSCISTCTAVVVAGAAPQPWRCRHCRGGGGRGATDLDAATAAPPRARLRDRVLGQGAAATGTHSGGTQVRPCTHGGRRGQGRKGGGGAGGQGRASRWGAPSPGKFLSVAHVLLGLCISPPTPQPNSPPSQCPDPARHPPSFLMCSEAAKASPALAQACHVLELQLWHCLPAFVSWATDLPDAYAAYVKVWAGGEWSAVTHPVPKAQMRVSGTASKTPPLSPSLL